MINFFLEGGGWGGDEVLAAVPLKVYLTSSLNFAFTQLKLLYIFIVGMAYSALKSFLILVLLKISWKLQYTNCYSHVYFGYQT